jgi:serine/threonine protein kinase
MNRYKVIKALGDGTYGSVFRAVNRSTGEVVRRIAARGRAAPRPGRPPRRAMRPPAGRAGLARPCSRARREAGLA